MKLNIIGSNQTELQIGNIAILFSYETPVAALVPGRGWIKTARHYSKTTSKHINAWVGGVAHLVPQSEIDALLPADQ